MRLKENFFDEDAIQILESMQDGYLYSNILLKLYLKSIKRDGKLMFNDVIPYNSTVLATITHHQVGTIERALQIFQKMKLIEILDNGAIYMLDIQSLIGKSTTEADRKRSYRARIDAEKKVLKLKNGVINDGTNVQINSDKYPPEIELNIDIELEQEKEMITQVVHLYSEICKSYPPIRILSEERLSMLSEVIQIYTLEEFKELFEKAENSKFLRGENEKGWRASFDWLIKPDNIPKVLEGRYDTIEKTKKTNSFNNFNQRKYDNEEMEGMLLTTSPCIGGENNVSE